MCISYRRRNSTLEYYNVDYLLPPVLLVETLLVHLDLAFTFALESGDLLAPSTKNEAHHGVQDEDLLRGGLNASAQNLATLSLDSQHSLV